MADKPIIFSAPMVQALLAGRKTQTRRIVKPQPNIDGMGNFCHDGSNWGQHIDGTPCTKHFIAKKCPYGKPGDRLWVRENWRPLDGYSNWDVRVLYGADNAEEHFPDGFDLKGDWQWPKAASRGFVPSIHMPRWASRLTLIVTDVRVQRLQDISEEDAKAEGCGKAFEVQDLRDAMHKLLGAASGETTGSTYRIGFAHLWNSINGPDAWSDNPFVYAVSFIVHKSNIDALKAEAA
jgi:hypothetical protein